MKYTVLLIILMNLSCGNSNSTVDKTDKNNLGKEEPKIDYIITEDGDTTTMVKDYSDSIIIYSYMRINGKRTLISKGPIDSKNKVVHGEFEMYYPNGDLWAIVQYNRDRIWNVKKVISPTGELLESGTLKNGNGIIIGYYVNGNIKYKGEMKDGYKVGNYTFFDSNTGEISRVEEYERDPEMEKMGFFDKIYVDPRE